MKRHQFGLISVDSQTILSCERVEAVQLALEAREGVREQGEVVRVQGRGHGLGVVREAGQVQASLIREEFTEQRLDEDAEQDGGEGAPLFHAHTCRG